MGICGHELTGDLVRIDWRQGKAVKSLTLRKQDLKGRYDQESGTREERLAKVLAWAARQFKLAFGDDFDEAALWLTISHLTGAPTGLRVRHG